MVALIMSLLFTIPTFSLIRITSPLFRTSIRAASGGARKSKKGLYATKIQAELPTLESRYLDPQPDVDLATVCYGLNYFSAGEEVKLKDNSEYPDWLWTLLDPVPEDPSNVTYARRLRKAEMRAKNNTAFYDKRWPSWKRFYPQKE